MENEKLRDKVFEENYAIFRGIVRESKEKYGHNNRVKMTTPPLNQEKIFFENFKSSDSVTPKIKTVITPVHTDNKLGREREMRDGVMGKNISSEELGFKHNNIVICHPYVRVNMIKNDINSRPINYKNPRTEIKIDPRFKKWLHILNYSPSKLFNIFLESFFKAHGFPVDPDEEKGYLILVRCPRCGTVQKSRTIKRKRCSECGYTWKIFLKRSTNVGRILKVIRGKPLMKKEIARLYKK